MSEPSCQSDLIADAVLAQIAAGNWSQSFQPSRKATTLERLKEMPVGTAFVVVADRANTYVALSRKASLNEYAVEILVQAKLRDNEVETVRPWKYLTEQIAESFMQEPLAGDVGTCLNPQIDPIYDDVYLNEFNVFASIIKLTVKAKRTKPA